MMFTNKSTPDEIRQRFDNDVERFSNLETGQSATIDSPLMLELVTEAAAKVTPRAAEILDIGCGAGNYSLKLLQRLPGSHVTLNDLSLPMLKRAQERVEAAGSRASFYQGDVREFELGEEKFDIVLASMVFHHLRDDNDWETVFGKLFRAIRAGGAVWIADMVAHEVPAVESIMWRRYGEYLTSYKSEDYRDTVFDYVQKEDTPRSLEYQTALLKRVGFLYTTVLHKNGPFAAFGGIK